MTPKAKQEDTLLTLFVTRWEEIGSKLTKLADEFPEKKFEQRPLESVRTFGEVFRHLAFWNQYVADTLRGKKADDSWNEVPLAEYPTKAQMVKVLERNSMAVVEALKERSSSLDSKTVELLITFLEHACEHYGQLVVYTRLSGITPPSSRAA